MYVCVCVCVCARAYVCVCVCVDHGQGNLEAGGAEVRVWGGLPGPCPLRQAAKSPLPCRYRARYHLAYTLVQYHHVRYHLAYTLVQ